MPKRSETWMITSKVQTTQRCKMSISEISPKDVFDKISDGEHLQLVDIREDSERNTAKIDKSLHLPYSQFSNRAKTLDKHRDIYLLCRSGKRAGVAAKELESLGYQSVFVIKGGMDAWARNGLPIDGESLHVWSLERQVRFTAGLIILTGIALSYSINANWIFLSVVAAVGMVFSSLMNTCGLATILRMMPWNCQHSR